MHKTLPRPPIGALARLISAHQSFGLETITLGSMPTQDEDDPRVPAGTLCVVCGDYESSNIASGPAHIILLEVGGAPRQFWVYRDELEIL